MENHKKRIKREWIAGVILLAAAGVLQLLARCVDGFGQWYAVTIYPVLVRVIGGLSNLVPFSLAEIGIYALILWMLLFIIRHHREIPRILSRLFLVISGLLFLYTVNCGINYYRQPFSAYLDLEVRKSSVEELKELCEYLTEKVNETAGSAGKRLTRAEYQERSVQAMKQLGETYPQLGGYYPRPKPVAVSWILSVQQLCGIYSPFTVEGNYNRSMPAYNIPHTISHELSHLKGFMREDEANFIGYLACVEYGEEAFQYSGYLTGWVYAGNALAKYDMEAYTELYRQLDSRAIEDLKGNSAFWNQYEGKVAEAANQLNDAYLKINSQEEGVQSYGRMVDLMLAYYFHGM
ncbi:MAG: DUF3810 domain-containing protein [Lachnospiraceae bacterium]